MTLILIIYCNFGINFIVILIMALKLIYRSHVVGTNELFRVDSAHDQGIAVAKEELHVVQVLKRVHLWLIVWRAFYRGHGPVVAQGLALQDGVDEKELGDPNAVFVLLGQGVHPHVFFQVLKDQSGVVPSHSQSKLKGD